jgi:hypothetical protein
VKGLDGQRLYLYGPVLPGITCETYGRPDRVPDYLA